MSRRRTTFATVRRSCYYCKEVVNIPLEELEEWDKNQSVCDSCGKSINRGDELGGKKRQATLFVKWPMRLHYTVEAETITEESIDLIDVPDEPARDPVSGWPELGAV